MLRRSLLTLLLGGALAILLIAGLSRLFALRYEAGDIYPPYSSLRADPLGLKALATALGELPGVSVRRNFDPLPQFRSAEPVTLVYAGVERHSFWTDAELLKFDDLVAHGSRAVFTFYPVDTPPSPAEEARAEKAGQKRKETQHEDAKERGKNRKEKKEKASKDKKDGKAKADSDEKESKKHEAQELIPFETVAKRWGFAFDYLPQEKDKEKSHHRKAALIEPGGHLEPELSWHSTLCFKDIKPPWKVLYLCDTEPVIIERRFGNGDIILAADSFFLSNEALHAERSPRLISRILDGPPNIIFDEEHNDLRNSPGIVSLALKYRLHGVIAGLLLLAVLFVWKNVVRFIPAYPSGASDEEVVAGKESSEGFISLLRRSIAPSAILEACVAEWRKTFARQRRDLAKMESAHADAVTSQETRRNPVKAYNSISRALSERN